MYRLEQETLLATEEKCVVYIIWPRPPIAPSQCGKSEEVSCDHPGNDRVPYHILEDGELCVCVGVNKELYQLVNSQHGASESCLSVCL